MVGIDEVGRGPLAGPVAIGIVVTEEGFDIAKHFEGLTDSKKMTAPARVRAVTLAETLQSEGALRFGVYSLSASKVDEWGIERSIRNCIERGLEALMPEPKNCHVYLDGRLKAPDTYAQTALIRGDSIIPAISLASVVAKVARDRYMTDVAHTELPHYGFDAHKGYGTASHIAAIRSYGPSVLHRKTFLSRI